MLDYANQDALLSLIFNFLLTFPLLFPPSFTYSCHLSFAAFSLFHPITLILMPFALALEAMPLLLTLPQLPCYSPIQVMHWPQPYKLPPSALQHLVKWAFLLSPIFSFHLFFPFIAFFLILPFKHHLTAVPCVVGHCLTSLVLPPSTIQLPSSALLAPP